MYIENSYYIQNLSHLPGASQPSELCSMIAGLDDPHLDGNPNRCYYYLKGNRCFGLLISYIPNAPDACYKFNATTQVWEKTEAYYYNRIHYHGEGQIFLPDELDVWKKDAIADAIIDPHLFDANPNRSYYYLKGKGWFGHLISYIPSESGLCYRFNAKTQVWEKAEEWYYLRIRFYGEGQIFPPDELDAWQKSAIEGRAIYADLKDLHPDRNPELYNYYYIKGNGFFGDINAYIPDEPDFCYQFNPAAHAWNKASVGRYNHLQMSGGGQLVPFEELETWKKKAIDDYDHVHQPIVGELHPDKYPYAFKYYHLYGWLLAVYTKEKDLVVYTYNAQNDSWGKTSNPHAFYGELGFGNGWPFPLDELENYKKAFREHIEKKELSCDSLRDLL